MILIPLAARVAAGLVQCGHALAAVPRLLAENWREQWHADPPAHPRRADEAEPPDFLPPFY